MAAGGNDLRFQPEPTEHFQGTEIEIACAWKPRDVRTLLNEHRHNPLLAQQ
jgi:hypothetical protein